MKNSLINKDNSKTIIVFNKTTIFYKKFKK
jgi:hypothetical protein